MKHWIKSIVKRTLFSAYKLGTKLGLHVFPVHYYSPVPDIVELEKTQSIWATKSQLPGVAVDLGDQVGNLETVCMPYQSEYAGNAAYRHAVDATFGLGYGYIEAQALHAVIRYYKPKRIIEVGGGVSTWCMLAALRINEEEEGTGGTITCIEPYPSETLKSLSEITLVEKQVQEVSYGDAFATLEGNDLLFIDSSHTVKPGSDVNHLILEILPRLNAGVIVHFHDIYLPYDYERRVLRTVFHWMETSLLRAFLIHNDRARIIFCQSHLHYDRQDAIKRVFPEYNPQSDTDGIETKEYRSSEEAFRKHFPSSTYIQIR